MSILVKRSTLSNIPIKLIFVVYPILSAISNLFGLPRVSYEVLNLLIFPLLIILGNRSRINRYLLFSLFLILICVIIKYIFPIISADNVVWRALFIDLKWIIYLIISILFISVLGGVSYDEIYNSGKTYSKIYIVYVILMTLKTGVLSRENSGLLSECNYDCFLMLIPFCFYNQQVNKRSDFWLFVSSVLLSTSKTGVVSLLTIISYKKFTESRYKLFIILSFLSALLLWVYIYFIRRGISAEGDIDRVVYFTQFFDYLANTSSKNLLFGIFPGQSMMFDPIPAFEWTISRFENINNITGAYPFIFHSTYMRLVIVWGIPAVLLGFVVLLRLFFKTNSMILKNLIILFLLESISLSSLSLENISLVYILTFITVLQRECRSGLKN